MRLGLGSYACAWAIGVPGFPVATPLDATGVVARAAALGLTLAQLDDNLPLDEAGDDALDALAAHAARAGVALEVGTRGCDPARLRRYLAIARRVGATLVRTLLERGDDRPDDGEAARRLRAVAADYERAGVTLAVENHDRLPAARLAAIVRAVGSARVGVCLDTVNSLGAGEGAATVVAELADLVVNLHLKDFAVTRAPHHMGFVVEGRPAGAGQLDVAGLVAALRGRGVDAILELWVPPAEDAAATVAREAAWQRESVARLRPLIPA